MKINKLFISIPTNYTCKKKKKNPTQYFESILYSPQKCRRRQVPPSAAKENCPPSAAKCRQVPPDLFGY